MQRESNFQQRVDMVSGQDCPDNEKSFSATKQKNYASPVDTGTYVYMFCFINNSHISVVPQKINIKDWEGYLTSPGYTIPFEFS